MAIGTELLGVEVLVGAWDAGAVPAPDGGYVLPASSVGMTGDSVGFLGGNMTWQTSRSVSSPPPYFSSCCPGALK